MKRHGLREGLAGSAGAINLPVHAAVGLLDSMGNLARDANTWSHLKLNIDFNAQGIAFAANKRRRKVRAAGA